MHIIVIVYCIFYILAKPVFLFSSTIEILYLKDIDFNGREVDLIKCYVTLSIPVSVLNQPYPRGVYMNYHN